GYVLFYAGIYGAAPGLVGLDEGHNGSVRDGIAAAVADGISFNRDPVVCASSDVHPQIALARIGGYPLNHPAHRGVPDGGYKLGGTRFACRGTVHPCHAVVAGDGFGGSGCVTYRQFEIHRRRIKHQVLILIENKSNPADHVFPGHGHTRRPSQEVELLRFTWLDPEDLRLITTLDCRDPAAG